MFMPFFHARLSVLVARPCTPMPFFHARLSVLVARRCTPRMMMMMEPALLILPPSHNHCLNETLLFGALVLQK